MNPSTINAMTAMSALQQKLDVLANNIANLDTIGYKRQDATFHDILTSQKQQHPAKELPGRLTDLGLTLGRGAAVSALHLDFSQGSLRPTDQLTDVAIEGAGLFEIHIPLMDADGEPQLGEDGEPLVERAWTRSGAFQLTPSATEIDVSYLATQDGHLLRTTAGDLIAIEKGQRMTIDEYGRIFVASEHEVDQTPQYIGQLNVVHVVQPAQLEQIGANMYRVAADADVDTVLHGVRFEPLELNETSFEEAGIAIRQGFLEQSNVNLIAEITELINIQRAYQLSARALSSSDAMMGLAVQLRG